MKSQIDNPVTFFVESQNSAQSPALNTQESTTSIDFNLEANSPILPLRDQAAFPDWTRMACHYATFQEFQRDRGVSVWRLEEAMFRLLGRGYEANSRLPLNGF